MNFIPQSPSSGFYPPIECYFTLPTFWVYYQGNDFCSQSCQGRYLIANDPNREVVEINVVVSSNHEVSTPIASNNVFSRIKEKLI